MDVNSLINILQGIENKTYIPVCRNKYLFYFINDIKIFPKFVVLNTSLKYTKYYNVRQIASQLIKLNVENSIIQVAIENDYYDIKSVSNIALNYISINISLSINNNKSINI